MFGRHRSWMRSPSHGSCLHSRTCFVNTISKLYPVREARHNGDTCWQGLSIELQSEHLDRLHWIVGESEGLQTTRRNYENSVTSRCSRCAITVGLCAHVDARTDFGALFLVNASVDVAL